LAKKNIKKVFPETIYVYPEPEEGFLLSEREFENVPDVDIAVYRRLSVGLKYTKAYLSIDAVNDHKD